MSLGDCGMWMVVEPRPDEFTEGLRVHRGEEARDSCAARGSSGRGREEAGGEPGAWHPGRGGRAPRRRAVSHVDGCRVWSDADRGLTIRGSDTLAVGDLGKDTPVETRGLGVLEAVPSRSVGGAEMLRPGGRVCGHGNECLLDFLFR